MTAERGTERVVRPDGTAVLIVAGSTLTARAEDALRAGGFDLLCLSASFDGDFSRICAACPQLKRLEVRAPMKALNGLDTLAELESLEIDYLPARVPDISGLQRLRWLHIGGSRPCPWALGALSALRGLSVESFKGDSLAALGAAPGLETLILRQGNLRTLEGIATLPALVRLECSYLRRLESLAPLAAVAERLQQLHVERCPRLCPAPEVTRCLALSKLFIDAPDPGFHSTHWLAGCKNLGALTLTADLVEVRLGDLFASRRLRMLRLPVPVSQLPDEATLDAAAHNCGLRRVRGGPERIGKRALIAAWFEPLHARAEGA